jgi:glycosyltransferase involved in cell wall biosynthesis
MRIGIDYTAAVRQRAGIGRYTRNLVQAMAKYDAQTSYTLFVAGGQPESGPEGRGGDHPDLWPPNFRIRSVALSDRWLHILWQRLRVPVPVQVITGPLDLFHSPDFVLPPLGRTPGILTVHDLSFLRVPNCFLPGFRDYLERAVSHAVHRAALILADSDSTRRDLVDLLNVGPERVVVLYPGVEARFCPIQDVEVLSRVRGSYDLPKRFVLGLGTLQPRKNFVGLIEAFAQLIAHSHKATDGLHLVIVGSKGWMADDIPAAVVRCGVGERVRLIGFVEDGDLPALYNLAVFFAFPTWYEGFGLPVLEAMACGTPVVAADNSSLPEVVGQAGLLVPAGDQAAIVEGMKRLLDDPLLRARLMAAGCRQAQRFSWEKAAHQLSGIYQEVLNHSHSHNGNASRDV